MPTSKRHSAIVELRLIVAGVALQLSQVGPDHAILKVPMGAVAAGYARIEVIVGAGLEPFAACFYQHQVLLLDCGQSIVR